MQLFYSNHINDGLITLPEQESSHCVKVLRMKADEKIQVTDGMGTIYTGIITLAHDKKTTIRITDRISIEPVSHPLHLYVAITKHADRIEWMLEKAVEFGISSFTPLITQRTERKNIRVDRLTSTVLSAMKQSLKAWLPIVHEPVKFEEIIKENKDCIRLIAHCNDGAKQLITDLKINGSAHLFIGPEGDFTAEEIKLATEMGAISISLGKSRLRTETAALAAVNWMYWINTKTQL